jgi:hypothetical protein
MFTRACKVDTINENWMRFVSVDGQLIVPLFARH